MSDILQNNFVVPAIALAGGALFFHLVVKYAEPISALLFSPLFK
ncbi:hypothetical protein [Metabacillus fastidiosus]|uniref:Uncharacterized protein n=1 Tax=Metabacillus fastidiosus TaxID=1458 RepID=A0ABU6NRQ8_9BACI|nr:hypothetical protein [Metabacillus fastidiosus]